MSADAELIAQLRARAEKAETELAELQEQVDPLIRPAHMHSDGCHALEENWADSCSCRLATVPVGTLVATAQQNALSLRQERDEWRTKAMDVNAHPAVVALKRERDAALGEVEAQVSQVTSIRREFERRDMDPRDVVQTVRALLESHRRHLIGHREEKAARARAEAESGSLLRRLQLIGEAAESYDHAEKCGFDGYTGCTCMLALVDVEALAPSGAAILERLRTAEAVVKKARTVTCAKDGEDVDLDTLIDEYDAVCGAQDSEVARG